MLASSYFDYFWEKVRNQAGNGYTNAPMINTSEHIGGSAVKGVGAFGSACILLPGNELLLGLLLI